VTAATTATITFAAVSTAKLSQKCQRMAGKEERECILTAILSLCEKQGAK